MLSGLNLREVADEAGVNRGLVYHYFGTRRDLLRAALRRDVEQRLADIAPGADLSAAARYERFLRTAVGHRQAIVLALLLVLDGDKGVRMVPDPDGVRERLERDVDEGALTADVDPVGVHAAMASLVYGYTALREHLADEMSVAVDRLDEHVAATMGRMFAQLVPDTAPA